MNTRIETFRKRSLVGCAAILVTLVVGGFSSLPALAAPPDGGSPTPEGPGCSEYDTAKTVHISCQERGNIALVYCSRGQVPNDQPEDQPHRVDIVGKDIYGRYGADFTCPKGNKFDRVELAPKTQQA